MNAPNQQTINILIVVCSLEQTRYDMSKIVLDSIAKLLNTISNYKIYILENGSTFQLRKSDIPFSCTLLRMKKNLGYWSALYLFLKYLSNKNDEAGYIYLVESDNLHYNLARLDTARNFLNHNPSIVSVRSQEFNIRLRSFLARRVFGQRLALGDRKSV